MSDTNNEVEAAKENLRVIRGLMEKATVYRTISAPVALVGGAIAIGIGAWMRDTLSTEPSKITPTLFVAIWMTALALVAGFNAWLISRGAKARNEPFVSSGMRVALRAFAPAFFAGGVTGTAFALYQQDLLMAAVMWLIFYGIALLATGSFAPQSIGRLGFGFLAFGLIAFAMTMHRAPTSINDANVMAATLMGAGFGVLHLAYGASVFFHSLQSGARR